MSRVARASAAVACGFAAGLAVGPVSLLAVNVSSTLVEGKSWPEADCEYARLMLITSVPAGVNGAVGAVLAAVWGVRGRLAVTLLPAAVHVVAGVAALVDARSHVLDYFLLYQLAALTFTVGIWPAGRLGQPIGWALCRRRSPDPAA
ncbi:MAG: hypothetical protein C0501_27040 [Isosphaera sp.]|nr:hypothetical protein [Isosphaera sp.]